MFLCHWRYRRHSGQIKSAIVIVLQTHPSHGCLLFFLAYSFSSVFVFTVSEHCFHIKLYFIFPFPGISKMYTDIIRGESMIVCSFTTILFGFFRSNILHLSVFRGRSIFLFVYFLKSCGAFQFILKFKYNTFKMS